jgi:threonine/homoserine/homoserine lactone efflux protein
MDFYLQAFGIGFLLSVMVGPVFFVLLETSITKGVRAALALDLGVFISDIVYILFAFIFASQLKSLTSGDGKNNLILAIIGGILFIGYGIYSFFKKAQFNLEESASDSQNNKMDYVVLAIKGFVLNFANPAVIFYWIGIIAKGYSVVDNEGSHFQIFAFVLIVLLTYFGIDVLKIFGAKKLRPLVTESLLVALNRLIGLVFFSFGLFLLLQQFLGKM